MANVRIARSKWLRTTAAWAVIGLGAVPVAAQLDAWTTPQIIWFPPDVPVFGEQIADRPARGIRDSLPRAPSGLGDYVNERFYPALSTRLHSRTVGSRMTERIDAYRAQRGALINELADQLVALHGADGETRRAELEVFSSQQAPKLAALEQEADAIRRELIEGSVLQLSVDWNRRRKWFLGVTRFPGNQAEREAEFQVVRAAAYYQDGLTPEQRGLLLEEAGDLRQRAVAARPVPPPKRGDPAAMYFSPATSRLRLPRHAPPSLVARIGRFNQEKNALKAELRDAVFKHDGDSREERAAVFAALADSQWPRIVELEKLAEEIRIEMATLPVARLAAPPHIPPAVMARIEEYNRDRRKFLDDFEQTMRTASAMVTPPRYDPRAPQSERMRRAREIAEERAALRAKVSQAFEEASRERFEMMKARYEAIRTDLALVAAGQFDPETGRPLTADTLLHNYGTAIERFETFGREEVIYRGYRTAMLMPGLSAAQRRLLFGAALVGLAQPLPPGEYPPVEAQPVPQS